MYFPWRRRQSAFTMIELLLVVGIIGVLAGIVIVAINPSKQLLSARDARRSSTAREIQSALSQYLIDNGAFPVTLPTSFDAAQPICRQGIPSGSSNCISLDTLIPTYIAELPVDSNETNVNLIGFNVHAQSGRPTVTSMHKGSSISQDSSLLAFTASTVAGLQLWLKADAVTASDGATVTTWSDESGNGRNATGGAPPIYRANRINSKPILEFFGNKFLNTSASFLNKQTYAVFRSPTAVFNNYGTPVGAFSYTDGRPFLFEINTTYFHSNPYPGVVRRNGVVLSNPFSLAPLTSFMLVALDAAYPTNVRPYQIGGSESSYGASLEIAEILIYDSVLSTTDQAKVENYLRVKYNLY